MSDELHSFRLTMPAGSRVLGGRVNVERSSHGPELCTAEIWTLETDAEKEVELLVTTVPEGKPVDVRLTPGFVGADDRGGVFVFYAVSDPKAAP